MKTGLSLESRRLKTVLKGPNMLGLVSRGNRITTKS